MSKSRIGVYPGTFDPITLGHMDIIRRGAKLVDKLVQHQMVKLGEHRDITPEVSRSILQRAL